jgi:hypothetical protein
MITNNWFSVIYEISSAWGHFGSKRIVSLYDKQTPAESFFFKYSIYPSKAFWLISLEASRTRMDFLSLNLMS